MSFFKKTKKDIAVDKNRGKAIEEEIEKKVLKKKAKEEPFRTKTPREAEENTKKSSSGWLKAPGQLAVDVYQTDSDFCVQAPIGGIDPEDIDISVENEMLVLKGERREPEQEKEKSYFYQECYWGPFSRQIILPEDVDLDRTKASFRKGILTVKIPRVKKVKKKNISLDA